MFDEGRDPPDRGMDRRCGSIAHGRRTDPRLHHVHCVMNLIRPGPVVLACLLSISLAAQRVAHVVVALCDNVHQGIVPVPAALGNGQDPDRNLYWGAGFGVRSWFMRKQSGWRLIRKWSRPKEHVLERCLWKHTEQEVYLLADAYDGVFIAEAINDVLGFAGGHRAEDVDADGLLLHAGGAADLIGYCGHDGLMEFPPASVPPPANARPRDVVVLACISKRFFEGPLKATGASPLLWTTGLMAPEAYTLDATLQGWARREPPDRLRERAAQAYAQWQKCGVAAARRLLVTGW